MNEQELHRHEKTAVSIVSFTEARKDEGMGRVSRLASSSLQYSTGETMTKDQWIEYVKRSKAWSIRVRHELLHSQAYKELTYGPALKLLNWFFEKREIRVNKKRRGVERYEVVNNGNIAFDYFEAGFRGLSHQQFRKALLELHRLGFIEVTRPGSILKDDHSLFGLSDRWKQYGTPGFEEKEYPKSCHWVNHGFGAKEKKSYV